MAGTFIALGLEAEPTVPAVPVAALIREGPREVVDLTRRLVAGDEVAWRQFHDRYFDRLLRYLLVVTGGREEAAREALQLTFVRAVRHIRRFDTEPALWSWLTVLARSSVVDEHRKRSRYLAFLDRWWRWQATGVTEAGPDPEPRLRAVLDRGLEGLEARDRRLLRRKYFDGGSVREIADQTGETEKAIESRLGRARRKLKEAVLASLKDEPRD